MYVYTNLNFPYFSSKGEGILVTKKFAVARSSPEHSMPLPPSSQCLGPSERTEHFVGHHNVKLSGSLAY